VIANDKGYNLSQHRFLSILAKTLPPSAMGFGRKGTAASLSSLITEMKILSCEGKKLREILDYVKVAE